MVKLLVEKSTNIDSKDTKYSQTLLLWAAKNGYKIVMKLLIKKGTNVDFKDTGYSWILLS